MINEEFSKTYAHVDPEKEWEAERQEVS